MIATIVRSNISHRPVRTLLSILLIGISVTLILTLVGVSRGIIEDNTRRSQASGADLMIRAPGTSLMGFSGVSIPEQMTAAVAKFPHVAMAAGTVNASGSTPFDGITGIDPTEFIRMSGPFVFDSGHMFKNPDDVIIDTYYAQQRNLHVGDQLNLLNQNWNVSGIYQAGKLSHVIVRRDVLQKLGGNTGKLSVIWVKVDDPANVTTVIEELDARLKGYPVVRMSELTSLLSPNNIPPLRIFIRVVIGIAVIIAFAVTSLSMYMAILQRTREIGILKSLGGSQAFVMRLILAEAVILGLGGTVLGILLSFVARWILHVFVPASMPQAITPDWWPWVGLIALSAATLGAIYPGMIAVRQDPIEALAYE